MYQKGIKRALDFIIALAALPLAALIAIPVSIAIRMEDGGSVFYRSERYGLDMKKFWMLKFRTMKMDAPDIRNSDGTTFNSPADPRLTRTGGFLRKTSIDELPQLINVLRGEMSLVGPRPSPMGNEATYTGGVRKKFAVRPGITGYNQALLRNSASLEERYRNDLYYVEHVSFRLDAKILLLTAKGVLFRQNVYRKPEAETGFDDLGRRF